MANPPNLKRLGTVSLGVGVVGFVGLGIAFLGGPAGAAAARHGYLYAYLVALSLSLGMLGLTLLQALVRARWGLPIVRVFEAGGGVPTFGLLALLFLPLGLLPAEFFPWVGHTDDPRSWYLNVPFLWIRFAVSFAFFLGIAFYLRRSSLANDPDGKVANRRTNVAAPSFVALFFLGSFAAYDLLMSLDDGWTSTIFGMLFLVLSGLGAMGLSVAFLAASSRREPYAKLVEPSLLRDYGNLLLTLLMLWAYLTFSQYIIDWSGNLRDEARYFALRTGGVWDALSVFLIVGGFFGPFLALQVPALKSRPRSLSGIGLWVTVVQMAHLYWMAAPALHRGQGPWWPDLAALLGIGGLWGAAFVWGLTRAPLVPEHDPILRRILDHAAA